VWLDDAAVEIVDNSVPVTDVKRAVAHRAAPPSPINLDLEN
jgi:hypothetical protein